MRLIRLVEPSDHTTGTHGAGIFTAGTHIANCAVQYLGIAVGNAGGGVCRHRTLQAAHGGGTFNGTVLHHRILTADRCGRAKRTTGYAAGGGDGHILHQPVAMLPRTAHIDVSKQAAHAIFSGDLAFADGVVIGIAALTESRNTGHICPSGQLEVGNAIVSGEAAVQLHPAADAAHMAVHRHIDLYLICCHPYHRSAGIGDQTRGIGGAAAHLLVFIPHGDLVHLHIRRVAGGH